VKRIFAGKVVLVGILLSLICGNSIAQKQELIFFDDFSSQEINTEWKCGPKDGWQQSDGQLVSTGYKGSAVLQKETGEDFVVQAKVRPVGPAPDIKGGYGGIKVSGINFVLRQDGFWWPYQRPGASRYSGGFKKAEVIPHRWYHFRVVKRTGGVFEWYVDGEKICELSEPDMKGDIALFVYGYKTAYDNFQIEKLSVEQQQQTSAVNLIRNSSFEIVRDGLPLFWGTSGFDVPSDGTLDEFYRVWSVDAKEKYEGKNSLRISHMNCRAFSFQYPAQKGKDYVFSAYLKSDADGIPVNLYIWEWLGRWHKKTVNLTRQWQRYEIVMSSPERNDLRGVVEPVGEGTIWIDAVQMEQGREPTEYRKNALDGRKGAIQGGKPEVTWFDPPVPAAKPAGEESLISVVRIAGVSDAPVVDGRLDDPAWKVSVQSPPFLISTMDGRRVEPKEKTEAFLCYDRDNLYIGFRCFDSQIDRLKATLTGENAVVWIDECVEVFLDTNRDRRTYYQFSVNPLGAQNVQDFATKLPWDKRWSVKTNVDKDKGYWTVEMALPLASLGITLFTAEDWGINLCRENHKANEYTSTSPVSYMNFHDVPNYGVLKWPGRKVFSDFLYEINSVILKPLGKKDEFALEGFIKNGSSEDISLVLEGSIGEQNQDISLALPAGTEKKFSFGRFLLKGAVEVKTVLIVKDKKEMRILREHLCMVNPLHAVELLTERSYYTDEEKARVALRVNIKDERANRITLNLNDIKGKTLWTSTVRLSSSKVVVDVPIGKIECGDYTLTGVLHGLEEITASAIIRKAASIDSEVKIDRIRRVVLVNDKPFLAIAPLVSFLFGHQQFYKEEWEEVVERTMKYWADAGFASLCVVGRAFPMDLAVKGWKVMFDSAERYGLKIIAWPGHLGDIKDFRQFISSFRNHPALLAWLVFDEPEIQSKVKPEDVIERVTAARETDPYHPVYVNYTPLGPAQRYAGLPGDIISTDYYVMDDAERISGRTIEEVVNIINMKEKIARERHIPTWMFIAGNNLSNHCREIPAQQQESQTYAAVIAGCSGLKYFFGHPYGRNHWDTLKRVNKELLSLTPVLFSQDERPEAESSTPSVLVTARRHEGKTYVIAVSVKNEVLDVSLNAGISAKRVSVLFEDRTVPIEGTVVKDTFQPYQRHVYMLE
jgi:hypothetical protein